MNAHAASCLLIQVSMGIIMPLFSLKKSVLMLHIICNIDADYPQSYTLETSDFLFFFRLVKLFMLHTFIYQLCLKNAQMARYELRINLNMWPV
jgi:hypothetical protein